MAAPPTVLEKIRQRPAHERRILALTAYASAAAVVIAIAIASLEQTLLLPAELPKRPAGTAETALVPKGGTAAPTPQPAAPLAALREAAGTLTEGIRNLASALRRLEPEGGGSAAAPATVQAEAGTALRPPLTTAPEPHPLAITPTPAAPSRPPAAPRAEPLPPPPVQPSGGTPAGPAPGLAPLVAPASKPKPYSSHAASRLLAHPPDLPVRPSRSADPLGRIGAILAYNFGEIRRAAADVFQYFAE